MSQSSVNHFWRRKLLTDVGLGSTANNSESYNSWKLRRERHVPLIAAVENNSPLMCTILIQSGKCDPNVRFDGMEYPLIHGLQRDKCKAAEMLLQLGANPRCRSMTGVPACFFSCMKPSQGQIFNWIYASRPDALLDMSADRETCLLVAAKYGNHKVLADLCNMTSQLADIPDRNGVNALMMASMSGNMRGFKCISKHVPFYRETYHGKCSLCYMATLDGMEMLEKVLTYSSIISDRNLEHCIGNCIAACIHVCVHKPANIRKLLPWISDVGRWKNYTNGTTLLHVLASNGDRQTFDTLGPEFKDPTILNSRDNEGNTPLMTALKSSNSIAVNHFLGASPQQVDKSVTDVYGVSFEELLLRAGCVI